MMRIFAPDTACGVRRTARRSAAAKASVGQRLRGVDRSRRFCGFALCATVEKRDEPTRFIPYIPTLFSEDRYIMKKTVKTVVLCCVALLAFSCMLLFAGCGKSEAVKAAEDLIDEIGDVSLDSADAIQSAKEAVAKLSDEEREKVGNSKKLTKAEEVYNNIKAVSDDIEAVVKSADVSFSDDSFKVSENLDKIEDIKTRYNDLKKYQQESIKDFDKLDSSAEKLNGYVENAKKAAVQYVKAFLQTEKGKDATVTAVYCVKQIRNETDEYHFMALTYKGADGTEHDVYSGARFTPEVSVEAIKEHADTFFADSPVSETGNAKTKGNVTLNAEEIVAAAK